MWIRNSSKTYMCEVHKVSLDRIHIIDNSYMIKVTSDNLEDVIEIYYIKGDNAKERSLNYRLFLSNLIWDAINAGTNVLQLPKYEGD